MAFKVTPSGGRRYWLAISVASVCGTNLGDIVPDVLKVSAGAGLITLAIMFALVVIAERATARGSEAFYWVSILIVRAAATNIADCSIAQIHSTYIEVSAVLTLILIGLIVLQRRSVPKSAGGRVPPANGVYWTTMLIAGSLGTVIADGIGHSLSSVQIGVPVSAAVATVALFLISGIRVHMTWFSAASYWTAVVVVRWWGTNVGDISAYVLSLLVSAVITGLALVTLLLVWRPPQTQTTSEAQPLGA